MSRGLLLARVLGVAALLVVVVPAAAGDEREGDWGIHGEAPAARTGPAERVALSGDWVVAPRRAGGPAGRFEGRTVRLPFVPNARRVTGPAGVRSHQGSVAWYRTEVEVPRTGRYVLRFESVNHRASVWIDGRRAGGHVGEYLPFEVRAILTAGRTHTLVVRADWRDPDAMKAAGWHRTWFNFGGINREVTIRPADAVELDAPTIRTRLDREDGSALVDVTARVRNHDRAREVDVSGTLTHDGDDVALDFAPVEVRRGGRRTVRAQVRVEDPELWAPGTPALHALELRIGDEPEWRGRVGLREVRKRGTALLLNGERLVLRGASLHEDARGRGDGLRPEDMDGLVGQLTAVGGNATRAHHPLNPALLERLDAAGILVWQGIGPVDAPGSWTSVGPVGARQARRRVRATVRQTQTHPSILAWNLVNEAAGQGHPDGQVPYVVGAARELRRRDPGRLVALDIWGTHPPRALGPMYRAVDAIGWTNYIGWYEDPYAPAAATAASIRSRLALLRRALPGKAIVVTEFGAEGNRRNAVDTPGGFAFQAALLRTHLETYAAIGDLGGALVWNLRDFAVTPTFAGGSINGLVPDIELVKGINQKGLFTYDGRPKPAARAVRDQFARAAR